ncbi:hypothetical protein BD410DRAFT_850412 [Rickenella mellea]|uniref:Uncharacterized protein n=1 Tax=Rickenella mellea TaxID=50990 RepID=A0A4R5XHF6_9AGAM|nr:hypothetical protein BD410DRAFT_850412 [Rickenella mellea]
MRQNPELLEVDCPFPCLGLYVIGSMLGFIGLAFTTDNIHIQPLGPALRLDYHPSDMNLRRMTARYLGAFKCSIARLKNYYENDFPKLPPLGPQSRSNSSYPCYFEYKPLTSPPTETTHMTPAKKSEITYTSQPHDDKLVYYGQVEDKSVCIKFTTSYSKDAHVFCASLNFAPKLLGFEELAGGWYMIIMERIDELYIALDDALTAGIPLCDGLQNLILSAQTALQQGNFVHGDLRAANLMVKKDGTKGFMILDFDWAGRPENVRYPMNLNAEVWRPEGAVDEALITKDHDDKMIQHVLESLPGFKAGSV